MRNNFSVFKIVLLILVAIFAILGGVMSLYSNVSRNYPKHILHLSTSEKRTFIESFDHVMSDCDGKLILPLRHVDNDLRVELT